MFSSYYEFHNPVKVISGKNAFNNLFSELKQLKASYPIIIIDKDIVNTEIVKLIKKIVSSSDIVTGVIFKEVCGEASEETVVQIAKIFRKKTCDSIVAIGGSTVGHISKGVNILVSENSEDLILFTGTKMVKNPLKPMIMVPVEFDTDSVVSKKAVISNLKANVKMYFISRFLFYNAVVLDPRMIVLDKPSLTATTAMGALANAIDSCTCNQKNPLKDAYCVATIKTIRQNIISAVKDHDDKNAQLSMINAIIFSDISYSNSKAGLISTLGHAVEKVCNISYDTVISVLLPYCLEFIFDENEDCFASLLFPFGGIQEYAHTIQAQRAKRFIELIYELQATLNDLCDLPTTLKEVGIPNDKFMLIAQTVIDDDIVLNLREDNIEDIFTILQRAYEC